MLGCILLVASIFLPMIKDSNHWFFDATNNLFLLLQNDNMNFCKNWKIILQDLDTWVWLSTSPKISLTLLSALSHRARRLFLRPPAIHLNMILRRKALKIVPIRINMKNLAQINFLDFLRYLTVTTGDRKRDSTNTLKCSSKLCPRKPR